MQLRPAIVHTRNLGALEAQVPAWAAGVRGRVHGEHGRDADDVDGSNRRHILMRRVYRRFVQQHIALGGELAAYLRGPIGVPDSQLTAIYNGVDHQRFSPAPQRLAIPGCPFTDPALWLRGHGGPHADGEGPAAAGAGLRQRIAAAAGPARNACAW